MYFHAICATLTFCIQEPSLASWPQAEEGYGKEAETPRWRKVADYVLPSDVQTGRSRASVISPERSVEPQLR